MFFNFQLVRKTLMRKNRTQLIQLMRALNRIDDQYYRVRNNLKIKESLFVLLYACADGKSRSQKDICDEWYIPRTTLNTTVKEQEAAGHVELLPCGNKQKLVKLTARGQAYAEKLLGPLFDAEERVGSTIDKYLIAGLESFDEQLKQEFNKMDSNSS